MAAIFSRHSSNPCELPTSDPQNLRCRQQLEQARAACMPSSDDPLTGYSVADQLHTYQTHINTVFPGLITPRAAPLSRSRNLDQHRDPKAIEEQEELVYSEDELNIVPAIIEPQATGSNAPVSKLRERSILNVEEDEFPDDEILDLEDELTDTDEIDTDTDEELSILLKSQDEQDEIAEEIEDLKTAMPQLSEDYEIIDRLGTGTFSSVYKAIDLGYYSKWHNITWQGRHLSTTSSLGQPSDYARNDERKVYVAIKRIYVTSNPERIRNEISILEDCRGCRHVSQLITAFRHKDQVVVILPYHRNDDFRDIYRLLPMPGIKAYFRCLLRALRDIHSRGILHRDVKPANFLFDARTYEGTLCDFGLACRVDFGTRNGHCLHTPATAENLHGKKKPSKHYDVNLVKSSQREARLKSSLPSEKVGYLDKDMRPISKANRAGTRGFRAPEVLLKCSDQTGAIDIWSVGMIFLFYLTGKFPLFQSNDDIEALMEIASVIGRRRMESAATLHSRTFATNVPSITREGMTWREFVEKNNPNVIYPLGYTRPSSNVSNDSLEITNEEDAELEAYRQDLELAFDFLEKLLLPESIYRITARDALYHPFLAEVPPSGNTESSGSSSLTGSNHAEDTELGDDAFFPHPIGEGRCGEYHFLDEVTEEHSVRIIGPDGTEEVRVIQAGEGIPIGNRPCEFHESMPEFQNGHTNDDDDDEDSGKLKYTHEDEGNDSDVDVDVDADHELDEEGLNDL